MRNLFVTHGRSTPDRSQVPPHVHSHSKNSPRGPLGVQIPEQNHFLEPKPLHQLGVPRSQTLLLLDVSPMARLLPSQSSMRDTPCRPTSRAATPERYPESPVGAPANTL